MTDNLLRNDIASLEEFIFPSLFLPYGAIGDFDNITKQQPTLKTAHLQTTTANSQS